jgi:hypothetical protein
LEGYEIRLCRNIPFFEKRPSFFISPVAADLIDYFQSLCFPVDHYRSGWLCLLGITISDGNKPFTVYSVRNVEPQVIRAYGVVRYSDSIDQARQNPYLGENVMIVPVSGVTRGNMIMIGLDAARVIRETTRHGNDYLKSARVIVAAR